MFRAEAQKSEVRSQTSEIEASGSLLLALCEPALERTIARNDAAERFSPVSIGMTWGHINVNPLVTAESSRFTTIPSTVLIGEERQRNKPPMREGT